MDRAIMTWQDDGGSESAGLQAPAPSPSALIHATREGWLMAAKGALARRYFDDKGYALPEKLQCSCGWCRGNSKAIGQCFDPKVTPDGTTHIFICPTLADPVWVLATLLHEMIHAAIGVEEKHGKLFKKIAREFGLAGKATATYAEPNTPLHADLLIIAEKLGPYPHSPMTKQQKLTKKRAGWVRLKSINEDGYRVVISPKMLEEHGRPVDPWGDEMVDLEEEGGEE